MLLVVFAFSNFIACRRRLLRKEYLTTAYVIRSPFLARIVPSLLRSFPPEASLIPDRRFGHDLFSAGGEFSSLSCPGTSEVTGDLGTSKLIMSSTAGLLVALLVPALGETVQPPRYRVPRQPLSFATVDTTQENSPRCRAKEYAPRPYRPIQNDVKKPGVNFGMDFKLIF